jgi:hypothetical protein
MKSLRVLDARNPLPPELAAATPVVARPRPTLAAPGFPGRLVEVAPPDGGVCRAALSAHSYTDGVLHELCANKGAATDAAVLVSPKALPPLQQEQGGQEQPQQEHAAAMGHADVRTQLSKEQHDALRLESQKRAQLNKTCYDPPRLTGWDVLPLIIITSLFNPLFAMLLATAFWAQGGRVAGHCFCKAKEPPQAIWGMGHATAVDAAAHAHGTVRAGAGSWLLGMTARATHDRPTNRPPASQRSWAQTRAWRWRARCRRWSSGTRSACWRPRPRRAPPGGPRSPSSRVLPYP